MKKQVLTFGLLLITILTFGQQTKYVDTEELNIRAGAGTKYEIVDKISQGQKVTVLSDQGKWCEIELENGTKGFVSTKFLTDKASSNNSTSSSKNNSWNGYLIVIGFILYGLYKIKKFFSGNSSSNSSSSSRREPIERRQETQATYNHSGTSKQKYYCKCCGRDFNNVRDLTSNSCFNSPTKKHQLFEGDASDKCYCKCCGREFNNLRDLTSNSCFNSSTGKHQPYEGSIKSKYNCKDCGREFNNLRDLTSNSCFNSPTKKHRPAK